MRWFRFVVLVCVAAILQAGVLAELNIKPDLLLIVLVFCAIHCNSFDAVITSFTIGFAGDIIGSTMGPQIISFGLFGTALAELHRVFAIRKIPYQVLAIFIIGLFSGSFTYLLVLLRGQPTIPNIYTVILGTALYSSIVGPFLFLPIGWWLRIKTYRFSRY